MFGSPPKREGSQVQAVEVANPGAVLSQCIITSRMAAPCDQCGCQASPVHMPRQEHGLYCEQCCPACSKEKHHREMAARAEP